MPASHARSGAALLVLFAAAVRRAEARSRGRPRERRGTRRLKPPPDVPRIIEALRERHRKAGPSLSAKLN